MTSILKPLITSFNLQEDIVASYSHRVGNYQKCAQLAAVHVNTWKRFVKNKDIPADMTWNYFLLSINEHPKYYISNRSKLLQIDIYELHNQFIGETKKPSPLFWVLWLIQRDLHPLYKLVPRRTPIVTNYHECLMIGGLPATAYQVPTSLIKAKEYKEYLAANGLETPPLRAEEYVYGNNFADLSQFKSGEFVHPNTFNVVSAMNYESNYDYDFGTIDRMLKTRLIYGEVAGLGRFTNDKTQNSQNKSKSRFLGNLGSDNHSNYAYSH